MTKEKLLLHTADNSIIVFNLDYNNDAEKRRKVLAYKQFCEQHTQSEFFNLFVRYQHSGQEMYDSFDVDNTNFINKEIFRMDLRKQQYNYENKVSTDNIPAHIRSKPRTLHFDSHIDDMEISPLIKNLGFQIEPEDNLYDVYFDNVSQEYDIRDFSKRRASVNTDKRKIILVRNHFTLPPAEYITMQRLIASWERNKRNNPTLSVFQFVSSIRDSRERSLFNIYANEYNIVNHRLLILKHELTHIKNNALMSGLSLKDTEKRMSVEDYYRLEVEDERSAYLSQIINAVNVYMKNGNLDDFTMFDIEAKELVRTVSGLPRGQRLQYVQNLPVLLDVAFKSFERNHHKDYDSKQFKDNLLIRMEKVPLTVPSDDDRKEFFLRRSLLYHYKLYNPQTGAYEEKNLASLIRPEQEVKIDADARQNIIIPSQQKLSRRLTEYNRDKSRGIINPELVPEAKRLMRDNLHNPRFINQINGLEISSLPDDFVQPRPIVTSQPVKWSKDLREYWQKIDGYKELASTENEYTFAVNESVISYKAKNKVNLNKDAEYNAYIKLLQEPSNKNKPIIFKDTLTKEQALKLYVACVVNKRQMKGNLPRDFTLLKNMKDISAADLQKCLNVIQQNNSANSQHNCLQRINHGR